MMRMAMRSSDRAITSRWLLSHSSRAGVESTRGDCNRVAGIVAHDRGKLREAFGRARQLPLAVSLVADIYIV